jgi:hypothetical protein
MAANLKLALKRVSNRFWNSKGNARTYKINFKVIRVPS